MRAVPTLSSFHGELGAQCVNRGRTALLLAKRHVDTEYSVSEVIGMVVGSLHSQPPFVPILLSLLTMFGCYGAKKWVSADARAVVI